MEKYKKAIVLGAGFSKALCNSMPIVSDLFADIPKKSILGKFVNNLKMQLGDSFDVENCISYILSKEIFFTDKEDIEFYTLKRELLKYIHMQMKSYKPDNDKMDLMKKFLYYCIEENAILITFNYDLFIEKICSYLNAHDETNHKYNLVVNYGIKINESPFNLTSRITFGNIIDKHLQLLKVHGSFNWFNIKDSESADISDIVSLDDSEVNDIYQNKTPYFIPMSNTKHKYFSGSFYKTIWSKMNYFIKNAEDITFIGYGFPKTDFDNLVFFSSFKDKIKDIVIYNSSKDLEKKKSLEKIFTTSRIHTDGAVKYITDLVNITI